MHNAKPIRIAVLAITLLVLASGQGWAQSEQAIAQSPNESDPFAVYHNALSSAADDLLAATAQRQQAQAIAPDMAKDAFVSDASGLRDRQARNPSLSRIQALRPLLDPILREEGVPEELTAVVLVESGGRAAALSPKGARGIWQLMPDTARRYGLKVTAEQDERIDVVKSTRAAAHYLRDLYARFGNWPLALAAYNVGESALERMLDRTETKNFFSLSRLRLLPEETRNYVPAVLSSLKLFNSGTGGLAPVSPPPPSPGGLVFYAESRPGS